MTNYPTEGTVFDRLWRRRYTMYGVSVDAKPPSQPRTKRSFTIMANGHYAAWCEATGP